MTDPDVAAIAEGLTEVVLVEWVIEPDDGEPYVCGQEGVFSSIDAARDWITSAWPFHKDHGHVIEVNPQKDDEAGCSIFASFVRLPFGRGLTAYLENRHG